MPRGSECLVLTTSSFCLIEPRGPGQHVVSHSLGLLRRSGGKTKCCEPMHLRGMVVCSKIRIDQVSEIARIIAWVHSGLGCLQYGKGHYSPKSTLPRAQELSTLDVRMYHADDDLSGLIHSSIRISSTFGLTSTASTSSHRSLSLTRSRIAMLVPSRSAVSAGHAYLAPSKFLARILLVVSTNFRPFEPRPNDASNFECSQIAFSRFTVTFSANENASFTHVRV